MKYVVLRAQDGEEFGHIFSRILHHSFAAEKMIDCEVIGAGFVTLEEGEIVCGGVSFSLGIASRFEEDARVLRAQLERPIPNGDYGRLPLLP